MHIIVTLFIVTMAPNFAPRVETHEVTSLEECIGLAAAAMLKARSVENPDRTYEIGCQIIIPPMREARA